MRYEDMENAVEAILFASGEAVEIELIANALGIDTDTCESMLKRMLSNYNAKETGLYMAKLDKSYQLCTRSEHYEMIRAVLDKRREMPLSNAALEVLAIVAYNQPTTRAFLEQVRGVDSSGVVQQLLEKNLIVERGRLDVPGRPMTFGTTAEFLRIFCISSLEELPDLEEEGMMGQLRLESAIEKQRMEEENL